MYLQCHSYYSLRYGTISEEELVDLAIAKGYSFAALTDINNSAAVLSFVKHCQKKNIPPIVGIDCRDRNSKGYVGIARSAQGFYNLNQFVSEVQASKKGYPKYAPDLDEVSFIYPFTQVQIENLQITLPNHYIGVSIKDLNRLRFSKLIENEERLVFLSPVSFRSKRDFNTHRLLRAIDNNTLLSKLAVEEQGDIDHQMLDINELKKAVNDLDFLLEQTAKLSKQCSFEYSFDSRLPSENQQLFGKNQEEDEWLLRRLCQEGITYRYPNEKPKELHARLAKELRLICEKSFTTYFLINWDLTREARKRGFFYVGRGSGANSLVAYLLRITDVDPIELNLYFERFINKYRSSPPDFDIDFSWRERDQMIQYLFERYPNVCLLGAYVTFQKRAVIREIGKVFGLSKEEIDALVANTKPLGRNKESDELQRLVLHYSKFIEGLPNHFSIHAGGMLITEKPIHYYATTFFPPKGFRTIHLDMHIAEDARLHKFDILSQRGLSKIADALKLIEQNQNKQVDIHQIETFKNDTIINELLARGDCMGCFYIESPAMRMLLQKLKVSNYLSLVAASSIIRPGVSQSGMMNEYILRHQNPEKVHQRANPVLLNIMPETYGVMVYQEDVIKVAHYYGGLSLAEADVVIDFTLPEATLANAAACAAAGTPMVIGTTGFSSDQLERLDAIAQEIPVCRAANFSTGVTLAYRLIELAAEVMGVDADVEIAETHHRNKIDAPSGTALAMGEVIAGVRGVPLDAIADYDRSSRREPRRAGSLGFSVSRLGDVVGDHTVSFGSDSERLEITHKASSRDAFALGALKAARWLVTKPSGCYDMNDVLGLARSGHE